ncbi:hypothetical protein [Solibaculum mannosilyticum]
MPLVSGAVYAAKMKAKLAQDSSTDTCGDLIGRYTVYQLSYAARS